jgi:tetrachloro-p-hydroquinone reductive dehalogenase
MSQLTLYHYPMSICSQKVRLCLAELQLPYEALVVDIGFGLENFEPWYVRLNPAGVVPTLRDGQRIVTDSAKILHYLALRSGAGLPRDARQRAEAERWVGVADAIPLHAISYSRGGIPKGDELLEKRLARITELRACNPTLADTYDALHARVSKLRASAQSFRDSGTAVQELEEHLDELSGVVGSNAFVASDTYSIADVMWTVTLARVDMLGLHAQLKARPAVAAYYQRVSERPSFAAASIQRSWKGDI